MQRIDVEPGAVGFRVPERDETASKLGIIDQVCAMQAQFHRRDGDVLHICLDRPHRHNAISTRLRDELTAALQLAALDDSLRTIEVSGHGPSFCSGGDLDEFGSRPDPVTAHLVRLTRNAGRTMQEIVTQVHEVSELVQAISRASHEQFTSLDEVNAAVGQIDQMTQHNAALVEQSSAASRNLCGEAEGLMRSIAVFQLEATDADAPADERADAASAPA